VADQVRRPADDLLEEGDHVPRHQLVGERAVDVGGAAVAAAVGPEDPEVSGEAGDDDLEGAGVGAPGVQEHQRLAAAVFFIPGADLAELHVAAHCLSPLVGWSSICRAGPVAGSPVDSDRPVAAHQRSAHGPPGISALGIQLLGASRLPAA
jgi:hypothetical protein